jgi:hypothetical protein
MEFMVLIDVATPAGGYFLSTPMYEDARVLCGITSHPVLRCTSLDWDKPTGFVRLVQAPDEQRGRSQTEWTLPSKCIALVMPVAQQPQAGIAKSQLPH